MYIYAACFFCLILPFRKNLLGSKRKASNIYFAFNIFSLGPMLGLCFIKLLFSQSSLFFDVLVVLCNVFIIYVYKIVDFI